MWKKRWFPTLTRLEIELTYFLAEIQHFSHYITVTHSFDDHIYPTAPLGQDMTQSQFLSGVYMFEFRIYFPSPRLVASPRLKNTVCPTILPIAGGRVLEFIPFSRVLVLCEMKSVSYRIWTRVAVSISYDDNYYTTGTSSFSRWWYFYFRSN